MRYFVFVEFIDPKVRYFLNELRNTFCENPKNDAPHITVRGPYSSRPDSTSLEKWKSGLIGNGVYLIDSGIFKTPKGYAVFLHAKSKIFDDIWYKPDYNGPKSERKPHVTIFESKNLHSAEMVQNFLNSEKISIFTYGVDLTVYTTKQHELLGYNANIINLSYSPTTQERILFKEGVFERGRKLHVYISQLENSLPYQLRLL